MITKIYKVLFLCLFFSGFIGTKLYAQDTLRVSMRQAENMFLTRNLDLLAERYNIDIAKAQVIQARLYNNPNLSFSGNIYNPDIHKPFDLSNRTGQYDLGIAQVIILAGKRNKQIKLAELNASMSENAFFDLLRTLRFTLRTDFYKAYFLLNSIQAYRVQAATLEKLEVTFNDLLTKGTVTLKDVVRIRSLLYSLRAEEASLKNDFNSVEAEIQLLLQNNAVTFIPVADSADHKIPSVKDFSLRELVDSAYTNRRDLKLTRDSLLYSQQNYALQKALATPDLTVGMEFDKRGSFVENASFFNIAIDLPFFNRNQGNIKAAKITIDQSKTRLERQTLVVENDVQHAYLTALNAEKMLRSVDPDFRSQFEQLLVSITQNFEKRNISLLEFADFHDSYKQNILQLNQLESDRMQAIEMLNFSIGKTIINP